MKSMTLVTGAGGFLGNNIVRQLVREGKTRIRAFLLPEEPATALEGLPCEIIRGDITKPGTLEPAFRGADGKNLTVIHCASLVYIGTKDDPRVRRVNVDGARNVMEKALGTGARLVYVSSVHAIPEPPMGETAAETDRFSPEAVEGLYAKTKAVTSGMMLDAVRTRGLDAVIVHPAGLIGPYDFGRTHLTQLITDVAGGKLTACVGGGYDFADVRDVADGIIRAAETGRAGECYLLTNRYVTVRELLNLVCGELGRKPIRTVLPLWFARVTAPLAEAYYGLRRKPPLYTKYSLYTLQTNAVFSHEKATRELGYEPRPIRETVRDTVAWLREAGRIGRPSGGKPAARGTPRPAR